MQFLDGKKTYLGIIITAIGAIGQAAGVPGLDSMLSTAMELIGLGIATYGRYKAGQ